MDLILESLKKELETASSDNDDQFTHLINTSMNVLPLSVSEMADLIGISLPGVRRWMRGITLPHPLVRPAVYRMLLKKIKEKEEL